MYPTAIRRASNAFCAFENLAKQSGLPHLSMGMCADFEQAIAFGADYVRVGSALFGERLPRTNNDDA